MPITAMGLTPHTMVLSAAGCLLWQMVAIISHNSVNTETLGKRWGEDFFTPEANHTPSNVWLNQNVCFAFGCGDKVNDLSLLLPTCPTTANNSGCYLAVIPTQWEHNMSNTCWKLIVSKHCISARWRVRTLNFLGWRWDFSACTASIFSLSFLPGHDFRGWRRAKIAVFLSLFRAQTITEAKNVRENGAWHWNWFQRKMLEGHQQNHYLCFLFLERKSQVNMWKGG